MAEGSLQLWPFGLCIAEQCMEIAVVGFGMPGTPPGEYWGLCASHYLQVMHGEMDLPRIHDGQGVA